MQGKYFLTENQFRELYGYIDKIRGLVYLMKYFSAELNISEVDSVIPAIEITFENADNLLCLALEIESNII